VGASVAFHLSQYGMDVSVFDKNEPGSGASGHSFAWINAFSKQPRHYFDLNYRSMDRWPRFAEDLDEDIGLRWGGNITYCSDPDEGKRLASECERLNSWGYSARLISSEELSKLEPNLEIGQFHTGIYTRDEGHVLPVKVAEACMNQIDAAGGKLHIGTEVESISQDGDKVLLHSPDGHREFDKVVIAAGTDSTGLALTAGINLPTEPPTSMPTQDIDTQDTQDIPDDLPELESVELSHKFSNSERVVLHDLKKEIYNNLEATVEEYDAKTQRYIVLLDDGKKLSIKEDNLKVPNDLEIVD